MANEETMVLARMLCPCGEIEEFLIPRSGLQKRARGVPPKEAFPNLPEDRLRQLSDHLCVKCRSAKVA